MGDPDDEGVPARAALREAIAALQNLHALVRSPRVGPKAIAPVAAEIAELLGPLGDQLEGGLGLVEAAAEHRAARADLVALARSLAASALVALGRAAARGADARSRLGLELELERLLPPLEAARELVDALEGSLDEGPVELDLRDMLYDAFASPDPAQVSWGRVVSVVLAGPLPSAPARVRPRTGRALLVGAVGWACRGPAGGPGAPSVLLRARLVGGRAFVALSAGPAGADVAGREALPLRVSAPIGPLPAALGWAAALSGARVRLPHTGPAAVLLFPARTSPG